MANSMASWKMRQAQAQWDEDWWDLNDLAADRPEWEVVEHLLPAGWEQAARNCHAMVRAHGRITSASILLRVLLIHLLDGCSLRETAVRAREGGLADVSDVALLKRLRSSGEWFRWMSQAMTERLAGSAQPV